MTTLFLMRHGRSTANSAGVLAGRAEGIELDATGRDQALAAGARLAAVPLVEAYASPLLRTQQTAKLVLGERDVTLTTDDRLEECEYGDWTGRKLSELLTEPLWPTIQNHPSAVKFTGGESLTSMSARAIDFVRERDRELTAEYGPDAAWLAVSHGDVIRAIVADAVGLHLDNYQRLVANPASISVINYAPERATLVALNTLDGDALQYLPNADLAANLGGGTGTSEPAS